MKVISTLAAASIAVGAVVATADAEHVERALILGGGEVPIGTKMYTTGIRETPAGNTYCGGALIDSKHVLTTALCTGYFAPNYVAVGTHYINGSNDGEQIKVVNVQNHTLFNVTTAAYNFAVLTLETPSKYKPIKLPNRNNSDIVVGMWTKAMGWGQTSFPDGAFSNELLGVGLKVWSIEDCGAFDSYIDNSSVCAGGALNKDTCTGDSGAPLIKEMGLGDSDDILIGLSSWGRNCGEEGVPSFYSRVSAVIDWINCAIKAQ